MGISIELNNLGPLRSAQADLADLTLLIGENNTGKTFFATVLHRILTASPSYPHRRSKLEDMPEQIRDWIMDILGSADITDSADSNISLTNMGAFAPEDKTLEWAKKLIKETLESYGESVRYQISYAFGAEASLLRRRTQSSYTRKCYLRVECSQPLCSEHSTWSVQIPFGSGTVMVQPPDPSTLLLYVLHPKRFQDSHAFRFLKQISLLEPSYRVRTIQSVIINEIQSAIFEQWPRYPVHLPADRTGIMQSHNVLAGAATRQSVRAGIEQISIEALTLAGTTADFLALVLETFETMPDIRVRPSRNTTNIPDLGQVRGLISKLEKDLHVKIQNDHRSDGADSIVVETTEGRFPMTRVSSMLSELAPLLLFLKSYPFLDHLTIDEPEAHLHPRMQIRLASFLTSLATHGVKVVVTTHSDFFVSEINNILRSSLLSEIDPSYSHTGGSKIDSSKVRVLHFRRGEGNKPCYAELQELDRIDPIDDTTFIEPMIKQVDQSGLLRHGLISGSYEEREE